MEVKGILDKIRQQEKEKKEFFFALEIGHGIAKSAIWLVEGGKIKVVGVGTNENWEEEANLLEAVDQTLSSVAEKVSSKEEAAEPNKVIFGLPSEWVEEEKIIPEKLQVLKELSLKLELEPVGFVVTLEAVNHYLKAVEGMPPTAVLTSLSKDKVALALVRLGKINPPQLIKRSENLSEDVIEGLSRYEEEEPFPARILLYDGEEDLEAARQELVEYSWQEEKIKEKAVIFLHLPKVEILPSDFDIKAVALAGGKEVARAAGIAADFEEEATSVEKAKSPQVKKEGEKGETLSPADFGFVKGKDILEEKKEEIAVEPEKAEKEAVKELPQEEFEAKPPRQKKFPLPKFSFYWVRKISPLRFLTSFTHRFSLPKFGQRPPLVLSLVLLVLLFLGGAGVVSYWYVPKASVVLLVEPRILEEEFEVKLDPSLKSPDKKELALPAEKLEVTVEGEETVETTGTKLIGEKARGEVTIFNGTSQKKTFSAGTTITSSGGIEFTLNEEVEIASQSGTAADPVPGKAVVEVTASEIGSEGNLAAKTEFTVANYAKSDYVAENESAFTLGTSRDVQVVASEDRERLLAQLSQELESESIDSLKSKTPLGKSLLEESLETSIISQTFDKEAEEEADELGLKLKVEAKALTYSEDEMLQLISQKVEGKIPDNFEFRREESETDFELKDISKKGVAVFTVKLSAKLLPLLDLEGIKQNLVGKYPFLGRTYLENIPSVAETEIKISPKLPSKLLTFPRVAKNIKIEVKVE